MEGTSKFLCCIRFLAFLLNDLNHLLDCLQVTVQAFNDEDPQGRRTLGKFFLQIIKNFIKENGNTH